MAVGIADVDHCRTLLPQRCAAWRISAAQVVLLPALSQWQWQGATGMGPGPTLVARLPGLRLPK